MECRAADVLAIDCPYTFSDLAGLETETLAARRLGYQAKSLVAPRHAALVNRLLTPAADEIRRARRLVEVPTYSAAKRLLARAAALGMDQARAAVTKISRIRIHGVAAADYARRAIPG